MKCCLIGSIGRKCRFKAQLGLFIFLYRNLQRMRCLNPDKVKPFLLIFQTLWLSICSGGFMSQYKQKIWTKTLSQQEQNYLTSAAPNVNFNVTMPNLSNYDGVDVEQAIMSLCLPLCPWWRKIPISVHPMFKYDFTTNYIIINTIIKLHLN